MTPKLLSSWVTEMYTLRQRFAAYQPSLNRAMLLSAVKEDAGTWQSLSNWLNEQSDDEPKKGRPRKRG